MFLKLKTVAAAAALAGVVAVGGAATAQAGTAVITSGGAITATAPSARLVVNGTVALNCTGAGATGTVASGTYTGAAPLTVSTSLGITFSGCTVAGIPFNVSCVSGASGATLQITGNTASGTTAGQIGMVDCTITLPLTGCTAKATGTVQGSYNNSGVLTVFAAGQALTVSNSMCTNVIPNGTAQYGGTGGTSTSVTNLAYTLGAVKPQVAATGF